MLRRTMKKMVIERTGIVNPFPNVSHFSTKLQKGPLKKSAFMFQSKQSFIPFPNEVPGLDVDQSRNKPATVSSSMKSLDYSIRAICPNHREVFEAN